MLPVLFRLGENPRLPRSARDFDWRTAGWAHGWSGSMPRQRLVFPVAFRAGTFRLASQETASGGCSAADRKRWLRAYAVLTVSLVLSSLPLHG